MFHVLYHLQGDGIGIGIGKNGEIESKRAIL